MVSLLGVPPGEPSQDRAVPTKAGRGPNQLATSRNSHLGCHAILGKSEGSRHDEEVFDDVGLEPATKGVTTPRLGQSGRPDFSRERKVLMTWD